MSVAIFAAAHAILIVKDLKGVIVEKEINKV